MSLKEYLGAEEADPLIPRIATGLAGGIGRSGSSHCGVLIGSVMAIGIKWGRDDPTDRPAILKTYQQVQKFWDRIEAEFGNRDCQVLTDYNLGDLEQYKTWLATGGREKCTTLIEKAFHIAFEYI